MSLFKMAYARGVADSLIRNGLMKVASAEVAEKIADHVGASFDFDPTNVTQAKTAALAVALMKTAADTGALIVPGKAEQENTAPNAAAQVGGLAAMDQAERPQGEYLTGVGVDKTQMKTDAGEVGAEQPHPKAPEKAASDLSALIRKLAGDTGSLVVPGKEEQKNTPEQAASQVGGTAAMDQKERPEGQYNKGESGVGQTDLKTEGGETGSTSAHPEAPSKSAAYLARFEATAREFGSKLPGKLSDGQKVAAVKTLMGLDHVEAGEFLSKLASEEPKKEESPAKCEKCGKAPCECEEKKASAILAQLRQVAGKK